MKCGYAYAAAAVLVLAAGSNAGFKGENGKYNGVPFNAGEVAIIKAAIAKLQTIATNETNAQNQATEQRVIDCLNKMLAKGQICKEMGTSTSNATAQDGSCDWKGDKINIRQNQLVATEPTCSDLAGSLMHEGIHAIQWAQPGSPYGGTEAKEEWVAYSWGKYIRQKRRASLTQAQKDELDVPIKRDCDAIDRYCAIADPNWKADAKDAGIEPKTSKVNPNHSYEGQRPLSGKIDILDLPTGTILRTLDTLFPLRTGLAVYQNNVGREVIIVGVCDANAITGAVVTFTDIDNDGLVDQSSRAVFSVGGGVVPTYLTAPASASSGPAGAILWMLAHLPGGSDTQRLYYVPDINSDFIPDPAAAIVFADGGAMPQLNEIKTVQSTNPTQLFGTAKQPGMCVTNGRLTLYTFQDFNNDHIADTVNSQPWETTLLPYIPQPLQNLSFFDVFVNVECHPSSFIQVVPTDANNNPINSPIGSSPNGTGQSRMISLSRQLNFGEYISIRDVSNNLWTAQPFQVGQQVPEILAVDLTEAMPGQLVTLTTRFVDPGNVMVDCSGILVPPSSATPTQVQFMAPPVGQYPPGIVEVELVQLSLTSSPVGLFINGDCNHNGIPDLQDVAFGTSQDCNRDGIPDECQCLADFNHSGTKTVQDLFDFLAAFFAHDLSADINCTNTVTPQDLFNFLTLFFGPCI